MIIMAKINISETIIIKRSNINFAPYNPRKKDPKIIDALKKNFKKVGFMGGIVWNENTGNLVGGHKRVEAMDLIFDYPKNDYEIKVEKVTLDEKTEKEQNIFLNNKRVQGETDYNLLSEIIPDIDIDNTGLSDYDLKLIESINPNYNLGSNKDIKTQFSDLTKEHDDNKQKVKDLKKKIKSEIGENQMASYFTVTFKSYDDKAEFLEKYNINGDTIFITGEDFIKNITDI